MIRLEEYFGEKLRNAQHEENARRLMDRVNKMLDDAEDDGIIVPNDPDTGTQISGARGGSGDGGYRLQTSATGAPNSKHKLGQAVDVYDPDDALDNWLTDQKLMFYGLYREHPSATPRWCHIQSVPPRSGRRTFMP